MLAASEKRECRGDRLNYRRYMPRIAGTTSVSATAPKSERIRGNSMAGGSFLGSDTRCRCRSRAEALVMDRHRGAKPGPAPQERAVGVRQPQAAVRGGIAPVAAPVVVVQAGPVAGEVLGEQDVLQVVAAWPKTGNADGVAVHRLIGDAPADGEHANGRRTRAGAVDRQRSEDWLITLVGDEHGRLAQIHVDPAPAERARGRSRQADLARGQVVTVGRSVPGFAVVTFDAVGDRDGRVQAQGLGLRFGIGGWIERHRRGAEGAAIHVDLVDGWRRIGNDVIGRGIGWADGVAGDESVRPGAWIEDLGPLADVAFDREIGVLAQGGDGVTFFDRGAVL